MEQTLSAAIGAIYDCVADEALWPQALSLIAQQVDGFMATIAVFDTMTRTTRLAHLACDNHEAAQALMGCAGEIPFYHLLHQMEIDEPVPLQRMFALYGPDGEKVWKEGDIHLKFHAQFSLPDSINMAVLKRPTCVATINIPVQYSEISRERYDIVSLLGPHIRRAITIHDMLEMERAETRVLRDVIDKLEHGVLIVTDDMELLYANPAAEQQLHKQVLIASIRGRLSVRFARAQAAIARAVSLGLADEISLGGAGIDIPLGITPRPALAHVMPLTRRSVRDSIETRAAAAIFIAAAGTVVQTAVEAIAALFALTSAERRVASYVSEGMTRYQIAEAQGVTEGTVKSQLAAIFDKTGTGDQRSLQSLMRELTPSVLRQ